jgi:tetratricopeptide (TPR) repeat protein
VKFDEAIDITTQIASGLAKAHEKGITHRDIKPGNVLITSDGLAKVVDFGLAKLAGRTKVTKTGTTVGTISYMSPEQARGADVDPSSDVFSLGVVLYELLSGESPFKGDHEAAVIYSIINQEPEPVETHRTDLPDGVQRVIDKALAKKRDERYPSAAELLSDLKKLQEGRQVAALERKTSRKVYGRALLYAAIGLVIVAAGYGLSRLVPPQTENGTSISPTAIAVFPFAVRGGDEFTDLGEGMVDLLSTKLDGAGALRSVDSRAILGFVKQEGGGPLDPERGRAAAEHFGAGLYLLGDIMAAGDQLNINASLYESGGSSGAVAEATVKGHKNQILGMVDELATRLLKDRLGGLDEFPFELAAVTTESYLALKAYMEGEQAFRATYRDHLGDAIDAFQRAVDEDSTFALAWDRLAVAVWWPMIDVDRTQQAINRAIRHSEGLPEQDRLRFRAFRAALYENDEEAEQLYRTIIGSYPDDVGAWHALGMVQLFNNHRRGRSPSEARDAFERALTLDPQDWQSIFHLSSLAVEERKYEEARELRLRLNPEGLRFGWRAIFTFAGEDRAAQDAMIEEFAQLDDWWLTICVFNVADWTDDLLRAQDVARVLTESPRSDEVRGLGHIILAHLEAARGRWQAADEHLRTARTLNSALALEHHALLAAMPFLPVPETELRAMRDAVTQWDADHVAPSVTPPPWFGIHDDMHRHLRTYLLGLLSVRLGDLDKALEHAAELERMNGPPHVVDLMQDLTHGIRAQVAWRQGDPKKALIQFEQTQLKSPARYWLYSPFYKELCERYLRAELLHDLGRDEEALGWTSSFGGGWGVDFVYRAPLHLRRAEYSEKIGQPLDAAEHYTKFIELWKDCDEELRPLVRDAQENLRNLSVAAEG